MASPDTVDSTDTTDCTDILPSVVPPVLLPLLRSGLAPRFDRVTSLVQDVLTCPKAIVGFGEAALLGLPVRQRLEANPARWLHTVLDLWRASGDEQAIDTSGQPLPDWLQGVCVDGCPVRSLLAMPIRVADQIAGALVAVSDQEGAFGPSDRPLLRRLTDLAEDQVSGHLAALLVEELRQDTHDALIAAQDALSIRQRFATYLSYGVRTPLNTVIGFAELLRRHPVAIDPEKLQDYATCIVDAGQTVCDTIEQVLFYSHLATGQISTVCRSVDIQESLVQAIQVMAPVAAKRRIDLVAPPSGLLRPRVMGDPSAIVTCICGVISNSITFSRPHQTVRCEIAVRPRDGCVDITVVDSGIGIPASEVRHVAHAHYRASNAIHGAYPGAGLGLYITAGLMAQMAGTVTVKSSVDVGTSVTLSWSACA